MDKKLKQNLGDCSSILHTERDRQELTYSNGIIFKVKECLSKRHFEMK